MTLDIKALFETMVVWLSSAFSPSYLWLLQWSKRDKP